VNFAATVERAFSELPLSARIPSLRPRRSIAS
jgi:hypothetical protein